MLRGSFGAVDRFSNIDETTFTLEPGRSSVMLNQCSQPGSAEAEADTVEGQGTLAFFPREEGASKPQDTGEPLAAPQKLGQVLVASNDHWLANRNARQGGHWVASPQNRALLLNLAANAVSIRAPPTPSALDVGAAAALSETLAAGHLRSNLGPAGASVQGAQVPSLGVSDILTDAAAAAADASASRDARSSVVEAAAGMASIGGAGLAPWGGAHLNMQQSNLGAPNIKLEEPMAAAAAALSLSHQPHASPPPQQQPPPQQPMPMMPPPHHSLLVPSATAQAEAAAATHLVAQSGLSFPNRTADCV